MDDLEKTNPLKPIGKHARLSSADEAPYAGTHAKAPKEAKNAASTDAPEQEKPAPSGKHAKLSQPEEKPAEAGESPAGDAPAAASTNKKRTVIAVVVGIVVAALIVAAIALSGVFFAHNETQMRAPVGSWARTEQANGLTTIWEIAIHTDGSFSSTITAADGTIIRTNEGTAGNRKKDGSFQLKFSDGATETCALEDNRLVVYQENSQTLLFESTAGA
ncbi:MAG: hypothetical protein Q4E12_00520 [Coriobacteriia bacterium]|nr:hypothetical protein [Coriobacteriia bacterium]